MANRRAQFRERLDAALEGPAAKPVLALAEEGERAGRRRDLTLFSLRLDRIRPDEDQVRRLNKSEKDPEIQELARSIKDVGVLQPLDVRYIRRTAANKGGDYYEIIAGERRYVAARLAGLEEVPVKVVNADEKQARRLQLIENIHRADLSPIELGTALQELLDEGASVEDLCKLLHKGRFFIQQALSISRNLAPDVKADIADAPKKFASMAHLYELSQLVPEQQKTVLQRIHKEGLTREDIRRAAVGAKQEARAARGNRRGRPAATKPYTKTFRTRNGASVTVRFRKAHASGGEVRDALREVLKLLAA